MRRAARFVLVLLTAAFWTAPALAQSDRWAPFPVDDDVTKFVRGPGVIERVVNVRDGRSEFQFAHTRTELLRRSDEGFARCHRKI